MNKRQKREIMMLTQNIAIGLACLLLMLIAIHVWANTPTVQVSWETKQCVRVLPAGSCDRLPNRYEREWVK